MWKYRKPIIIALAGFSGSGKDTFGAYLVQSLQFKRYAFADLLKDICAVRYNVPREWFDDRAKKDVVISDPMLVYAVGKTPREICIEYTYGQNTQYLLDGVVNKISADIVENGLTRFVITDCRRKMEIDFFKQYNRAYFLPIYINRFDKSPVSNALETEISAADCSVSFDNTTEGNNMKPPQSAFNNFERLLMACTI